MEDGFYQVTTPYLCAGFIVENNRIIRCAPILKKNINYWKSKAKRIMETSKELWVDTETTGLLPGIHGVYQVAGKIIISGEVKDEFNLLTRPLPGSKISSKAEETAHYTIEEMIKFPKPHIQLSKLNGLLGKYVDKYNRDDKFIMYGYNVRFDYDHLRAWYEALGDKYIGSFIFFPPVDIMNLAAWKLRNIRNQLDNFKLPTVAQFLGVTGMDDNQDHDALYDITITREVYLKLREYPDSI